MPFWVRFELSPGAVIYAIALAVLAAIIMGVLPGLKATGVSLNANLNELHGRSGTRLGATWATADFINRFREIGAEVDPALQLRGVGVLAERYEGRSALRSMTWAAGLVTASVLLLSAAGIYSMMSFIVAQRTREIGIRTALGAPPRSVMANVLGRAARQVAIGVFLGSILSGGAFVAIGLGLAWAAPLLLAVAATMAVVGLLTAFGPARRALRIQAIEALRAEG